MSGCWRVDTVEVAMVEKDDAGALEEFGQGYVLLSWDEYALVDGLYQKPNRARR